MHCTSLAQARTHLCTVLTHVCMYQFLLMMSFLKVLYYAHFLLFISTVIHDFEKHNSI